MKKHSKSSWIREDYNLKENVFLHTFSNFAQAISTFLNVILFWQKWSLVNVQKEEKGNTGNQAYSSDNGDF